MLPPLRPLHAARAMHRRRPRGSWAAGIALVLTASLALTACTGSGGGDPSPGPTATDVVATPSPTPTPSPTRSPKPERPAAMDDVSIDGAIAVATYFISLYPYVYSTGDLAEWTALSHPECLFCTSVIDGVTQMQSSGHRVEGAFATVISSTGVDITPGYWYSVELEVRQGSGVRVSDASSPSQSESTDKQYEIAFVVLHEEGAWRIRGVEPHEISE